MGQEKQEQPLLQRPAWVWGFATALIVVGVCLLVVGGQASGLSEYERSLFANVGVTVLLVAPLFLIERLLDWKVRGVGARVAAVGEQATAATEAAQQVSTDLHRVEANLDKAITGFREREREGEARRAEGAAKGDLGSLVELFEPAAGKGWVHNFGLRIPSGVDDLWVRVDRPVGGSRAIELSFEGADLKRVGDLHRWDEDRDAQQVFFSLLEGLKEIPGRFPGDDAISVDGLLADLARTMRTIAELHVGPKGDSGIAPVIELAGTEWAVTTDGLEATDGQVRISREDLLGVTFEDQPGVLVAQWAENSGLDPDQLQRAWRDAVRIHQSLERFEKDRSRERIRNFGSNG